MEIHRLPPANLVFTSYPNLENQTNLLPLGIKKAPKSLGSLCQIFLTDAELQWIPV